MKRDENPGTVSGPRGRGFSAQSFECAGRIRPSVKRRGGKSQRPDHYTDGHRGMRKTAHVFYSGDVQGVGFRLTAEETAIQFGIVGWVKNLRDGRVELVAEGEEEVLKEFLGFIRTGPMRNFIRKAEVLWDASTNQFEDFEIRY